MSVSNSVFNIIAPVLSAGVGIATAWFCYVVLKMTTRKRRKAAESFELEEIRRIKLRRMSRVYACFEPLIDEIATFSGGYSDAQLAELQRQIEQVPARGPWRARELLALRRLESLLVTIGGVAFGRFLGGWGLGLVLGPIAGLLYGYLMTKQVADEAIRRRMQLKSRLPFAVDLLAFMMEAGASFHEGLRTVVLNNVGHPLGMELAAVQQEIALGRSRQEALENLQTRLADEDIRELVFAINKGEEMGTPLSRILRSQADQMRIKRSQWLEKAAQEAQVAIVFPGMLIMLACLLIVVAPFLLGASM
jgi:tight adherence protein C